MNLLKETLQIISKHGKITEEVLYVNVPPLNRWDENAVVYSTDWVGFVELAEEFYSDYDNGYGGAEVPEITIIFTDTTWLERIEYDGAEWWVYKATPVQFPRICDEKG